MSSWHVVKLGGASAYTFEAAPAVNLQIEDVVRTNVSPAARVAANYRWTLNCRVRASDSAAAITAMQAAFTSMVNRRVFPTTLEIETSTGTDLDQIGDVGVTASEGWEDLRVTSFSTPAVDGQLVAGAYFTLGFAARKTYPDSNGVCEFQQNYVKETGSAGQAVRRLTTTLRLALRYTNGTTASYTIEGTSAIASQLKLAAPAGWLRTKGNTTLGFDVEYPDYPLLHHAVCVSEVTESTNSTGAGTAQAITADVASRVVEDPAKGIARTTTTAETKGNSDAQGFVEAAAPSDALVKSDIQVNTSGSKEAKGEWEQIEGLGTVAVPGADTSKVTRLHRRFGMLGNGRRAGVIEMSGGIAARVQVGAFVATRLREAIAAYAKGPTELAHVAIPPPLSGGWQLDGDSVQDVIGVDEDARDASQRLWLRTVVREYLWLGTTDPTESPELKAAIAAAMTEAV